MNAVGTRSRRTLKEDPHLASTASIDQARQALEQIASPADVGQFLGLDMEAERVGTLRFACLMSGYVGWNWVVTVARVPRARRATVSETELLPGPDALLAPKWLPWADRLLPGDLGPGDTLPRILDDPRLEDGYTSTGDEDADKLAIWEFGLGRPRVLSPGGRSAAAERWYAGVHGPNDREAVRATAKCSTCGFVAPLAGSLRLLFGVCANQWSPRDGTVVSYDHGCGAHSETDIARRVTQWPANQPMIDDSTLIPLDLSDVPEG
jgi:hypothetical protein